MSSAGSATLIATPFDLGAMTHQVTAARQGAGAVLRCSVCRDASSFHEDDFEGMSRFVREHKLCLDATA